MTRSAWSMLMMLVLTPAAQSSSLLRKSARIGLEPPVDKIFKILVPIELTINVSELGWPSASLYTRAY
jgi:hypothetical protein